jgi:hypothetical protein
MAVLGKVKSDSVSLVYVGFPYISRSLYPMSLEAGMSGIIGELLAATRYCVLQFARFPTQPFAETGVSLNIDHLSRQERRRRCRHSRAS